MPGCLTNDPNIPTTQTATDIDPQSAKPAYWLSQPAIDNVHGSDYHKLYTACDHVIRMHYYDVDRQDYRAGLLASKPLISQQIWEFWRRDVGSADQIVNSSLATYRRTIYWELTRSGDGYSASPRVVIEHYAGMPGRVTAVTGARSGIASGQAQTQIDSPRIESLAEARWYAVGRDQALERQLVRDVAQQLNLP